MGVIDVLVIGAGQAAGPILEGGRKAGRDVRIVERGTPGGSCVNWGCTPTKAVLASANLLAQARRASEFGLRITGAEGVLDEVLASADAIVAHSVASIREEIGDALITGDARLESHEGDHWRVRIGDVVHSAREVVINTGSTSVMPPIPGLEDAWTAENWLSKRELPARMAMLGGGAIALEMSLFYRRLGAEVTIVERGDRILPNELPAVGDMLRAELEREGVRFRLQAEATAFRDGRLEGTDVEADALFVAVGRRPNSEGLAEAGVGLDEKGNVIVDARGRTNLPGLSAAGDVRGGPQFTHTAWDDGRVIADRLFGDGTRTRRKMVPYAIFTDPQLGRTGEMEGEILEFDIAGNSAAQSERAARGRVWLGVEDGRVKGATALAAGGADLVQFLTPFVEGDLPVSLLVDLLTIHPTWTEAAQNVAL